MNATDRHTKEREIRVLIQDALDETTTHAVAWRLQAALNTLDSMAEAKARRAKAECRA